MVTCNLNGVRTDCGFAAGVVEAGQAVPCPNNNCFNIRIQYGPGGTPFVLRFDPIWIPSASVEVYGTKTTEPGYWLPNWSTAPYDGMWDRLTVAGIGGRWLLGSNNAPQIAARAATRGPIRITPAPKLLAPANNPAPNLHWTNERMRELLDAFEKYGHWYTEVVRDLITHLRNINIIIYADPCRMDPQLKQRRDGTPCPI